MSISDLRQGQVQHVRVDQAHEVKYALKTSPGEEDHEADERKGIPENAGRFLGRCPRF